MAISIETTKKGLVWRPLVSMRRDAEQDARHLNMKPEVGRWGRDGESEKERGNYFSI